MRLRHTAAVVLTAAALALTAACSSDTGSTPSAPVTVTATPALTPDDTTDAAIDAAWAQQTEDDKAAMCYGIALMGPEWAAEQLADGSSNSAGLDWDRAAVLIQAKCADR